MTDEIDDQPVAETPEDVAILYSWANLHGAKYRDFSASRREYRAQVRHRAAEELRQAELKAQAEAEAAAAAAEKAAREAEQAAQSAVGPDSSVSREHSLKLAEDAARIAAAERVEAARRAEAAAMAEAIARREEREIAEAHASAQRQAIRYEESETRRRELAGPQPLPLVPGQINDPYVHTQGQTVDHHYASPNQAIDYTTSPSSTRRPASDSGIREALARSAERAAYRPADRYSSERSAYRSGERPAARPQIRVADSDPAARPRRPQGFRPDEASGIRQAYRPDARPDARPDSRPDSRPDPRLEPRQDQRSEARPYQEPRTQRAPAMNYSRNQSTEFRAAEMRMVEQRVAELRRQEQVRVSRVSPQAPVPQPPRAPEPDGPAWLYSSQITPSSASRSVAPATSGPSSVQDTLQHSRERVAARWFALKGVFEPGEEGTAPAEPVRQKETRTPVLAVFSLAGGVGKTSLVATLGRVLSSMGEKVLLADTTSHGLLPFYFGASELRPGVVRPFSPPAGSTDAPILLVSYDLDRKAGNEKAESELADQLAAESRGNHRVLLDLNNGTSWVAKRIARMNPIVLVPVAPDMNSVISLQTVERFFHGTADHEGKPLQPYYVLNQFDASLPLHLDVREVLRRQLGDRLLSIVIRRSPQVSEALAEGMTVVDYAPEAPVAEDYLNIAAWLRSISAPASAGFRNVRWSER